MSEMVERIEGLVVGEFRCLGGSRRTDNPIAAALGDKPPVFALGVNVADVARFVIAAMREHFALADLVFAAELVPGHPVSWNAVPAVLEIIDAALKE